MVFNRILDGDHLLGRRVSQAQCAIERCRLAASGRTCRDDDPCRSRDDATKLLKRLRRHAELVQIDRLAASVEETKDDRFAVQRGYRRNPNVELPGLEPNAETPVLWRAGARQSAAPRAATRHYDWRVGCGGGGGG